MLSSERPPGLSRQTSIRRDAAGRWFHDGQPVTNTKIADAFDRWVDVGPDGRFVLRNRVNWVFVDIEGAPVTVTRVHLTPESVILWLSTGDQERLDPKTVQQDREGNLYCAVRGRTMAARFSRRAVLGLEPIVDEDERGVCLRIGSSLTPVVTVDDPLVW